MPSGSGSMTPPLAKRDPTELRKAAAALLAAAAAAGWIASAFGMLLRPPAAFMGCKPCRDASITDLGTGYQCFVCLLPVCRER